MIQRFILALLLVFIIGSCDSEKKCTDKMTSELNMGFAYRVFENGKWALRDTVVSSVIINGVHRPDSFLYDTETGKNRRKVSLPLSAMHDTSRFVFSINSRKDTLNVVYSRKNVFVNYECGFRFEFALDTAWFSVPDNDTIKLILPYVSSSLLENCKIILPRAVVGKP